VITDVDVVEQPVNDGGEAPTLAGHRRESATGKNNDRQVAASRLIANPRRVGRGFGRTDRDPTGQTEQLSEGVLSSRG
jgi:hypothetical protein